MSDYYPLADYYARRTVVTPFPILTVAPSWLSIVKLAAVVYTNRVLFLS